MEPIKYVPTIENHQFFSPLGSLNNSRTISPSGKNEWSDLLNLKYFFINIQRVCILCLNRLFFLILNIRDQILQLTNQLNREQRLRKNQDGAMETLRTSAEEITLLEAEEIVRLETKVEVTILFINQLIILRILTNMPFVFDLFIVYV